MPHLDSHLHQPTATGPTRDPAAEARAQPSWREEAFQMRPKRLPISLNANMKTRPRARLANVGAGNILMTRARTPVLVRTSNQRPLEAGTGTSAQEWNVSTPRAQLAGTMLPGMGAVSAVPALSLTAVGVGVGLIVFALMRRRA